MKLVGLLLLFAFLLVGCSGIDAVHAGVARGGLEFQVTTEPLIRGWRRDALTGEADRVHAAGGTREEAEAAVAAMSRRWQCAVEGHRLVTDSVGAYVDALWLEETSGGDFDLSSLLVFLRPLVDAYRLTASCVSSLGHDLPVPDFLGLIPSAWGLEGGGDDEGGDDAE